MSTLHVVVRPTHVSIGAAPGAAALAKTMPGLASLLARGWFQPATASIEERVCALFGIRGTDGAPVAALTRLIDRPGVEHPYWLRADPVHLHVDLAKLLLFDAGTFALSPSEAVGLTDTLNAQLAPENLHLEFGADPTRWYLRVPEPVALGTVAPARLRGRHVGQALPRGPQGGAWRRRANELQMLLHDHPVNRGRADQPINAVWFWGGGELVEAGAAPVSLVFGADVLLRGLARHVGAAAVDMPATASLLLGALGSLSTAVTVLEGPLTPEFDARWWRPLLRAVQRGRLTALECSFETGTVRVDAAAAWKLWKRVPGVVPW